MDGLQKEKTFQNLIWNRRRTLRVLRFWFVPSTGICGSRYITMQIHTGRTPIETLPVLHTTRNDENAETDVSFLVVS